MGATLFVIDHDLPFLTEISDARRHGPWTGHRPSRPTTPLPIRTCRVVPRPHGRRRRPFGRDHQHTRAESLLATTTPVRRSPTRRFHAAGKPQRTRPHSSGRRLRR
jgi:hypothetical protein